MSKFHVTLKFSPDRPLRGVCQTSGRGWARRLSSSVTRRVLPMPPTPVMVVMSVGRLVRHQASSASSFPGVERLMRQAGLAGVSPRRGKGFTRRDPDADPAPDLVQRDFTANVPNRLWVTDLTMIATEEGPLWLSAIRDAFSRRVVAWETSVRADADLVLTTLEYALASREVAPGELIHHADHGCQGEFNWSSQHLLITEVCCGTTEEADAAGATGGATAVGCGPSDAGADALAGPA